MRGGRNKMGFAFTVVILHGGKQIEKYAEQADEAYSLAYGNPFVAIEKFNEGGSVEDSAYFSPKHPLWSRGAFLKWARSRGRNASRRIRNANNRG